MFKNKNDVKINASLDIDKHNLSIEKYELR